MWWEWRPFKGQTLTDSCPKMWKIVIGVYSSYWETFKTFRINGESVHSSCMPTARNDTHCDSCYCDLWHSFEFLQVAYYSAASSARAFQPADCWAETQTWMFTDWETGTHKHTHITSHMTTSIPCDWPWVAFRWSVCLLQPLIDQADLFQTPSQGPHVYPFMWKINMCNTAVIMEIF